VTKNEVFLVHFTKFFKLKPRCCIRCLEECWIFHTGRSDKCR